MKTKLCTFQQSDVNNLFKHGIEQFNLTEMLNQYTIDEIQIMIQQNAFSAKEVKELRPYLKNRVMNENK